MKCLLNQIWGCHTNGPEQIVAISCASRALHFFFLFFFICSEFCRLRAIITSKILKVIEPDEVWKGKGNIENKNDLGSVSSVTVLWERKWSGNKIDNKKLTR